jgi:hypothetical protein
MPPRLPSPWLLIESSFDVWRHAECSVVPLSARLAVLLEPAVELLVLHLADRTRLPVRIVVGVVRVLASVHILEAFAVALALTLAAGLLRT